MHSLADRSNHWKYFYEKLNMNRTVAFLLEFLEKLLKQREQYEVAAEKLEDQLLKLKEQREILKGQGHKHEDNIMKENAKLQVIDQSSA